MLGQLLPWIIVLSGFFAFGLSTAIQSLREFSRSKLEEICEHKNHKTRFGHILRFHQDVLLITEALFSFVLFVFILSLFVYFFGANVLLHAIENRLSFVLNLIIVAGISIILTHVLPWSLSRISAENCLYYCWPLLMAFRGLFSPYISFVYVVDKFLHRLFGVKEPDPQNRNSLITEEIKSVIDEGQRSGVLESEAQTMIHRVMELQGEDVEAIMTPRTDMVSIPKETSIEEARKIFLEVGHSRIPVIGDSNDDIIGLLYAKDLLAHLGAGNADTVKLTDIIRHPFYVPETTGIDTLLEMLRREKVHVAIVLDEYSGVAGLVTMEDILEEIVGEIEDEYDPAEENGMTKIDGNNIEVDARVHIDDLNEEFSIELPEDDDFETIGGFVFHELGHVPKDNETINWNGLRITVLKVERHKIHRIRIEKENV